MEATCGLVLASIAIAVIARWIVKLLNCLWFRPRKLEKLLREQGLNGNPYRPFLGDLKDYSRVMKAYQQRTIELSDCVLPNILGYFHNIVEKYGQNSFVWFGPCPRLNIADPELIKEILMKPDVYQKSLPEVGKMLTGGLLLLEGKTWAKHRKIVNPAFHLEKLKNMVPAIGLSCSSMIDIWDAIVSNSTNGGWCEIDVWPYLQDLTGDVISRTAFGSSHEEGRRIFHLQREKVKLTMELIQFSLIPGWRYLPTKVNRIDRALTKELRGIIDKRQKALEMGETVSANDLLGILMESNSRFIQEHGNQKIAGMSIEDVIEECKLFYFAGSGTTATLLVWTMVLLCKYPEWQTQARGKIAFFVH